MPKALSVFIASMLCLVLNIAIVETVQFVKNERFPSWYYSMVALVSATQGPLVILLDEKDSNGIKKRKELGAEEKDKS